MKLLSNLIQCVLNRHEITYLHEIINSQIISAACNANTATRWHELQAVMTIYMPIRLIFNAAILRGMTPCLWLSLH